MPIIYYFSKVPYYIIHIVIYLLTHLYIYLAYFSILFFTKSLCNIYQSYALKLWIG